jgi:azurin
MIRNRIWILALGLGLSAVGSAPEGRQAAPKFELGEKEHIAIVGNTLAERLQYDGWLETMIQARFPKHELVVRNLGFSGDEIATRLRSKNFGTPDEWLSGRAEPIGGYQENRFEGTNTRADVVFAFFGYNESFAGQAGLDAFRQQLGAWITHTLAQRYNGKTAPRMVVFSPIAHENLRSPDLPDGRANNQRLALYTRAMGDVAKARGVTFVDLFTPTERLYTTAKTPLTINGIHLTSDGNRQLAQVIDRALFGEPAPRQEAYLTRLRDAVVDKDFHWFHRYRVTDGYSTYGDRAFLNFVRGTPSNVNANVVAKAAKEDILPTNYEVLQRELPILDVMTANRDRRIWAVARGADKAADPKIDDSDTPPFVDAKTNLPRTPTFLTGEDSLGKMTVGKGLKVDLFASEEQFPDLIKPVQIAFDTRGRLWVASWKSYPHWKPKTPMDDKLLILEDTNGDGRADKQTVFAGDLHNPTGFEFYKGGVIVAQQPNVVFLEDTNGDDRYDRKEIILHGFDSADTHHAINSFTFDPGGALYMQEGIFHRTQVETPWGPTVRQVDGGVYRFEPRTWKFETFIPMNFPNPHGHVFDYWGRDIVFDATGGQPYYGPSFSTKKYYPAMETRNAPQPGKVRVRPVGGVELLSSRHFPDAMQGNMIVLNTIGFRGLLSYALTEEGGGLKSTEVDPILQSADENFRPVDAEVGPDGALYFVDWHNAIIGHMQHNLRDNSRDRLHGRVFRVTYPGRPLLKPAQVAGAPIPQLLDLLKEPENRVRYRAKIELSGRTTADVVAALQTWIERLDPKDPQYEHHMMEALWVHQWHNRVNETLLSRMLRSKEPWARAAATRVLCYWRDRVANPLGTLKVLAADPHPGVRLEAVRTASFLQGPDAARVALASLESPQDRFLDYTLEQTLATLNPPLLLDVPAKAVEYQIARLSNADLAKVERKDADVRYRPVYMAFLTKKGLGREYFDEALTALTKMDKTTPVRVLLDAMPGVRAGDVETEDKLLRMFLSQSVDVLKKERAQLTHVAQSATTPLVLRATYGAMMLADGSQDAAWQLASRREGHLAELLRSVPYLPASAAAQAVRSTLAAPIASVIADAREPATRVSALAAIGWSRPDTATFQLLAREVVQGTDPDMRAAAIRSLHRIPREAWSPPDVEPLARAIVSIVGKAGQDRRTEPAMIEAMQLGDRLAEATTGDAKPAIRRDLRSLGVQIVRIETIPEQMAFDLKWFAVEAGKPVQIVLSNPDAMSHNLLLGKPGSLKEIGTAASTMTLPSDPKVNPYVPDSPLVLQSTRLLNWGETERLNFLAPKEPGEYPFVCTFPGHWVRMYGVMLVVENLEAWESKRTVPSDPMTGQPFAVQRN